MVGPGLAVTALHVVARREPLRFYDQPIRLTRAWLVDDVWQHETVDATVVEGRHHAAHDWVILAFDAAWTAPLRLRALEEAAAQDTRPEWGTWGFADANPEEGAPCTGNVQTARGAQGGVRALAMFSQEAGAGRGEPVKGLSGAPVIVDGAAVGVLRYALTDQDQMPGEVKRSEGGTLYATPIELLGLTLHDDVDLLGPVRPDEVLPERPFKNLHRYERADARVFFGRSRELRRFLTLLEWPSTPRVLLLHGATGVGKSSFLRAGVLPRNSEAATEARGTDGLAGALGRIDAVLPVVDQVEEAWTQGTGDDEFEALTQAIAARPGRVVLSFRSDWQSAVERGLRRAGLRFEAFELEPMGRAQILDAMQGFEATPAVQQHYSGLRWDDGVAEDVADVLLSRGGELGPILQVALTAMWELAQARSDAEGGDVVVTEADWLAVQEAGLGLREFVVRQLDGLEGELGEARDRGMALEVLAEHLTDAMTSRVVARADLVDRFEQGELAGRLADALSKGWLLGDAGPGARRLVHDTLGPIVGRLRAESSRDAQRVARRLEYFAREWEPPERLFTWKLWKLYGRINGRIQNEALSSPVTELPWPWDLLKMRRQMEWGATPTGAEAKFLENVLQPDAYLGRVVRAARDGVVLAAAIYLLIFLAVEASHLFDQPHLVSAQSASDRALRSGSVEQPSGSVYSPDDLIGLTGRFGHQDRWTLRPHEVLRTEWLYQQARAGRTEGYQIASKLGSTQAFEIAAVADGFGPAIDQAWLLRLAGDADSDVARIVRTRLGILGDDRNYELSYASTDPLGTLLRGSERLQASLLPDELARTVGPHHALHSEASDILQDRFEPIEPEPSGIPFGTAELPIKSIFEALQLVAEHPVAVASYARAGSFEEYRLLADLALALQDHNETSAALAMLDRHRRALLPWRPWPFKHSITDESDALAAANLGVAYARLGEYRKAHIVSEPIAFEWLRLYVYTEITAHSSGVGLWAPKRLPYWLHYDPADVEP